VSGATTRWGLCAAALLPALALLGCGGGGGGTTGGGGLVTPLALTTTSLPKAVTSTPYSTKLQATGGNPPYTWKLALFPGQTAASVLPPGLSFATDGNLSGTAAPGCYITWFPQFAVQDSAGQTAGVGLELDCVAPLTFSSNLLPDGNIALPYSALFNTQGGYPPIQFALASGSLPPGVTLDKTQALQGTPSAPGKYTFTIQASDAKTPTLTASQAFTLTVDNNLVVPNTALPDAVQNVSYLEQIKPAGGTPPYHFVLGPNSSMPPGLQLDPATGKVYGTPTTTTAPAYDPLFVSITDSASPQASINAFLTITVQPALSFQTTTLQDSARGLNYAGSLTIVGGRAPYAVQVTSGALPGGLTIAPTPYGSTFNVTGVPTTDGLFKFTAQVSDSYETPNTAKQDFQIRISDPMTLTGPTQVIILYNQSYSTTFPATGGFPPYTWSIDRTPPPGFTFDPTTGTLSGTPNGPSYTSPNIGVHDSSNPPLTATYFNFSLDVTPKLVIYTTSLPTVATASTVLLQPLTNGGAAPYQWSVSPGSLPPGISLGNLASGNATLTGSPTTAGVYTFTLNISDGNTGNLHQTTSQQLTWTVKDPGQMTRNDTIAQATALSNIALLASISPFSDPSSAGPDVDVYSMSAAPGSVIQVYTNANSDFIQPPEINSLLPVLEIVDSSGTRYQTCAPGSSSPGALYNLPCINGLPGATYIQQSFYSFQVPGTGTTPVTFYVRVSDARGDARPDFIYTLSVLGVN
jgi:Putative Ig domain